MIAIMLILITIALLLLAEAIREILRFERKAKAAARLDAALFAHTHTRHTRTRFYGGDR